MLACNPFAGDGPGEAASATPTATLAAIRLETPSPSPGNDTIRALGTLEAIITQPPAVTVVPRPPSAPPDAETLRAAALASFAAVNAERSALQLPTIEWDEGVEQTCSQIAGYLAENRIFSHWLPDDPDTAIASLFEPAPYCGENLALHFSLDQVRAENWAASPPHFEIAISDQFARGAAAVTTVDDHVRFFTREGSPYGLRDEIVELPNTHFILVFRICE